MHKITIQSYSKDKPDFILVKNIKSTRDNSGLTIEIETLDIKKIKIFTGYDGQYNTYRDSTVYNDVSCTDEFKEFMKYDTNALSSIKIEYIRN